MQKEEVVGTTYFIDQTSVGDHHMVFNSCMIEILAAIFEDNRVVSVGIQSNQESMTQLLSKRIKKNIAFEDINYPETETKNIIIKSLFYLRKEFIRFFNFNKLLRNTNTTDIIVLSITTFTSFLLFKLQKLFFKVPVIVVLHGDLDFVYNATNFYEKLNGCIHKLIFKIKAQNFYYLVLNKISKPFLIYDGFLKGREVFEINHPYNNLSSSKLKINDAARSLVYFGHIGSLEVKRKNSHYIYELGDNFKEEIKEHKIQFEAIGLSTPSMALYRNNWVNEIVGNEVNGKPKYLPRNEYESKLAGLDYALFFYSKDQYVFRASGAIADAIAETIPLIVLEHPYFDYLFEKGGNIGHICKNTNEMKILIQEIINNPQRFSIERRIQKQNFKKLQELMSVSSVAKDLDAQIEERNLYKEFSR